MCQNILWDLFVNWLISWRNMCPWLNIDALPTMIILTGVLRVYYSICLGKNFDRLGHLYLFQGACSFFGQLCVIIHYNWFSSAWQTVVFSVRSGTLQITWNKVCFLPFCLQLRLGDCVWFFIDLHHLETLLDKLGYLGDLSIHNTIARSGLIIDWWSRLMVNFLALFFSTKGHLSSCFIEYCPRCS